MSAADADEDHWPASVMTVRVDLLSAIESMGRRALARVAVPLNPVQPRYPVADMLLVPDNRVRVA
jgi:hypothetical protein